MAYTRKVTKKPNRGTGRGRGRGRGPGQRSPPPLLPPMLPPLCFPANSTAQQSQATTMQNNSNVMQKNKSNMRNTNIDAKATIAQTRKRHHVETTTKIAQNDAADFKQIPNIMKGMLTNIKTAEHCARRWKSVLSVRDFRKKFWMDHNNGVDDTDTTNECNKKNHISNYYCQANNDSSNDPFDCTDLRIPTNTEIIELETTNAISKWHDLNSRVVDDEGDEEMEEQTIGDADEEEGNMTSMPVMITSGTLVGDGRKSRILPPRFDYQCRGSSVDDASSRKGGNSNVNKKNSATDGKIVDATTKDEPTYYRPRVISLLDPTQTVDYEEELWHVFRSMPTATEVEEKYGIEGNKGGDSTVAAHEVSNSNDSGDSDQDGGGGVKAYGDPITTTANPPGYGCQHTLRVKNDLKELQPKYTRMDVHSMGRLRVRDRHSLPITSLLKKNDSSFADGSCDNNTNNLTESHSDEKSNCNSMQTTIRFEILRYCMNLKRGSRPDNHRLEVELSGSHTLLDLHRVLEECKSLSTGGRTKMSGNEVSAGVFFIENRFYTHGEMGNEVGMAINRWLGEMPDEGNNYDPNEKNEAKPRSTGDKTGYAPFRRLYLGLNVASSEDCIPMSDVLLQDLPFRLGVRYFHLSLPSGTTDAVSNTKEKFGVWSLDNESAVFITGIQTHNIPCKTSTADVFETSLTQQQQNHAATTATAPFPILLHDVWAPSRNLPICLGCNFATASVVTTNDEKTDVSSSISFKNGLAEGDCAPSFQGTPLCSGCYRELHYKKCVTSSKMLELRGGNEVMQVLQVEDFHRKAVKETLNRVPTDAVF